MFLGTMIGYVDLLRYPRPFYEVDPVRECGIRSSAHTTTQEDQQFGNRFWSPQSDLT